MLGETFIILIILGHVKIGTSMYTTVLFMTRAQLQQKFEICIHMHVFTADQTLHQSPACTLLHNLTGNVMASQQMTFKCMHVLVVCMCRCLVTHYADEHKLGNQLHQWERVKQTRTLLR